MGTDRAEQHHLNRLRQPLHIQNTVRTVADVAVAVVTLLEIGTTGTDDVTASSSPNGSYGRWSFSSVSNTVNKQNTQLINNNNILGANYKKNLKIILRCDNNLR